MARFIRVKLFDRDQIAYINVERIVSYYDTADYGGRDCREIYVSSGLVYRVQTSLRDLEEALGNG